MAGQRLLVPRGLLIEVVFAILACDTSLILLRAFAYCRTYPVLSHLGFQRDLDLARVPSYPLALDASRPVQAT